MIQTCHRARARSSSQPQHCCGPCPHRRCPRLGTCTARRRRSSSKRPFNRMKARRPACASQAVRGTTAMLRAEKHLSMQTVQRGNQPTRAERRSGSGSSTRVDRPRTTTPVMSSTPTEWATRKHERREDTTSGGADATTAAKIALRHRNPRGPVCSAGRSTRQAFVSAFASPHRPTSTRGKQTLEYGSMTIA
jgi:hypothetical protein